MFPFLRASRTHRLAVALSRVPAVGGASRESGRAVPEAGAPRGDGIIGWVWRGSLFQCGDLKLSVKSDYAARAVLGLARHYAGGEAQRVESLAAGQGIPANYLVQILIELKSRRIVRSLRGKAGGYLLARSPAEISLGEVVRCVHGEVFDTPALEDAGCAPELRAAWKKLQRVLNEAADAITFQQLLEQGDGKDKMYYI